MVFFFTREMNIDKSNPIGVYDSGVGGITVWKEIVKLLPNEYLVYYADNKNCPYGLKQEDEIIKLSESVVDFLLAKNCKMIVVACNTATAAAIEYLRAKYNIKFVGMEPAVKPAALNSKTGKIGVLATKGTFQGRLFNETTQKYAFDKDVNIQIGYGLVDAVEKGQVNTSETIALLRKYIEPMLENNVDQIVLGCTHYPFLLGEIQKIVGDKAEIIDPSAAVAKQLYKLLESDNLLHYDINNPPIYKFYTSGKSIALRNVLSSLGLSNNEIIEL